MPQVAGVLTAPRLPHAGAAWPPTSPCTPRMQAACKAAATWPNCCLMWSARHSRLQRQRRLSRWQRRDGAA